MRRRDKEIRNMALIRKVLKKAPVCRLALCEGDRPYLVPMNFACDGRFLYLHSAKSGRKINMLKKNPQVCFEATDRVSLVRAKDPCGWGMKYLCVIGFGRASFLERSSDKARALSLIMRKYSGKEGHRFSGPSLKKVCVIKVRIIALTGKKSGY